MIAYVTVGADDIARAKRFYSAFLPALDYGLTEGPEGLSYVLPVEPGKGSPSSPRLLNGAARSSKPSA